MSRPSEIVRLTVPALRPARRGGWGGTLVLFAAMAVPVGAQSPQTAPSGTPVHPTPPRAASRTPGVRAGGVELVDGVRVGGYGSIRFEASSLDAPKPSGFDFRRFVLTTDVTPHDRLQAYVEIEFERLAELELERSVERSPGGAAFEQTLEGGNGGEIAIEQVWGQFELAGPLAVRVGQILPPVGRFNVAHDDDQWDLPRRSLVDRGAPVLPVGAAWTELGAGLVGGFDVGPTGRLGYQVYAVNGAQLDFSVEQALESDVAEPGVLKLASEFSLARGPVNGEGGTRAGTWRLDYSPTLTSSIAVSGYHGRYTPDVLAPVRERINAVGVDGMLRRGGFVVEGEYLHADFGDTDRVIDAFIATITGSTGVPPLAGAAGTETEFTIRNLTPARQGFWVEARYRFWPDAWQNGPLGDGFENPRLTPVFRYERVTLNDAIDEVALEGFAIERGSPQTLRQERMTIGVSYRPLPSVVFSLAVEHSRRLEGRGLVVPRGATLSAYTSVLTGMAFGF